MKVTLTNEEIRDALAKAIEQKTNQLFVNIDPDDCWFEITAGSIEGNQVEDVQDVQFSYEEEVNI